MKSIFPGRRRRRRVGRRQRSEVLVAARRESPDPAALPTRGTIQLSQGTVGKTKNVQVIISDHPTEAKPMGCAEPELRGILRSLEFTDTPDGRFFFIFGIKTPKLFRFLLHQSCSREVSPCARETNTERFPRDANPKDAEQLREAAAGSGCLGTHPKPQRQQDEDSQP